jgi:hypothetical protein
VIHRPIETAEEVGERDRIAHIERPPLGAGQLAESAAQPCGIPAGDRDDRTCVEGLLGDGQSDSGGTAENDDALSIQ